MDSKTSSSSSFADSGVPTPIKRRKIEERNKTQEIIENILNEVAKFVVRLKYENLQFMQKPHTSKPFLEKLNEQMRTMDDHIDSIKPL